MNKRAREIYTRFELNCDGLFEHHYETIAPSTMRMGVCKIQYIENTNTLHVWLRCPGLLIGKGGVTIKALKKSLECEIIPHEVKNLWDELEKI